MCQQSMALVIGIQRSPVNITFGLVVALLGRFLTTWSDSLEFLRFAEKQSHVVDISNVSKVTSM